MDSCYLCVLGGATVPRLVMRRASNGFGTCIECNVHACQVHGDKMGLGLFRCADCLTNLGIIATLTVTPPTAGTTVGDPAMHSVVDSPGPGWFGAVAPSVSVNAAPLVREVNRSAMASALSDLMSEIRNRDGGLTPDSRLGTLAARQWQGARITIRRSLGLPLADRADDPEFLNFSLGMRIIRLAMDSLRRTADTWELRSIDDVSAYVEWVASALAAAYAARRSQTLNISPFDLPGGLRMPPTALLLGVAYQDGVSQ